MNCLSDKRPGEQPGCQEIDQTSGKECGETSTLQILDEFRKLYDDHIKRIHEESNGITNDMKLKVMENWIKDLGEQNIMLASTVEELEREAASRVILLEDKLSRSSNAVSNLNRHTMDSDETTAILTNRISELEKNEESLQQKIEFLQSDIRGLLELIRRARKENCWSIDGITFLEIHPSDIPTSLDCTCGQGNEDPIEYLGSLKNQIMQLKESEKDGEICRTGLEEKLTELNKEVASKEDAITNYITKLRDLKDHLTTP